MLLHKPKNPMGKSSGFKFAKKLAKGKATPICDLNVTPMVDMLTMLVIFLLMTFAASGEILFVSKDIVLPKAFNSAELERAPVIQVSASAIALEGTLVMKTEEANEKWYKNWKLTPLVRRLKQMAKDYKEMNPTKEFDGQVIVQSDGNVPFGVIKMVMASCAEAGFVNVNFAVQKGTRPGEGGAAPAEG